ncbi:hypothetical protein RRG08_055148 [Elysia crispata]|uniref:Uncharacterized protein n=1 Tax=Elysia crispata TaxID=231223 RepID=A0AAE1CRR2_9GAST|nr:hypothetical protein RRG08_055148 [Elysia crispata]
MVTGDRSNWSSQSRRQDLRSGKEGFTLQLDLNELVNHTLNPKQGLCSAAAIDLCCLLIPLSHNCRRLIS